MRNENKQLRFERMNDNVRLSAKWALKFASCFQRQKRFSTNQCKFELNSDEHK